MDQLLTSLANSLSEYHNNFKIFLRTIISRLYLKFQMNPTFKLTLLTILLIGVVSYRKGDQFITFNTSGVKYIASTSLATNLNTPFNVYLPLLFDNQNSTVKFIPNQILGQLEISPTFSADSSRLYNEHSNGEFWYAFKKHFNPDAVDTIATFAFAKITANRETNNYVLPLFSLPLTFLNFDSLYKCDDVLIAYQRAGELADVTIFSNKESWHLFPKAQWGFRHKDQEINFSRQTFPLETEIEIDVGTDNYCTLNNKLAPNTYNLVQQVLYTLQDLLVKYSTSLELKSKLKQEEL